MHAIEANLILYHIRVLTWKNCYYRYLKKKKLKVRIPLEVENCNNPAEEQHV